MKNLIIAGTGIKFLSHLTIEVKSAIETSSCVVFLLNEPAMKNWITKHAKKYISMDKTYFSSSSRADTYYKIADELLLHLKEYNDICFLIYGHPTFFSSVVGEIKKRISFEEVLVQIMPGISALDCLFADLNIDPGTRGLQSYDATEFILYDESFSVSAHLVLWQIAIVGELRVINNNNINLSCQKKALSLLKSKLMKQYPEDHKIILYVASQYPGVDFEHSEFKLRELTTVNIPRLATLYIPPLDTKKVNLSVMNLLKLNSTINN